MRFVIAYIKPHKLSSVVLALQEVEGLTGATFIDVRGFGRGRARNAPDRIQEEAGDFVPRVRVEVACVDKLADQVVEAIEKSAHTGLRGDGKILVYPLERAVRISTGERDDNSI